ncbi:porin [Acidobacteria bacterium AB60]|nr:porin [Acidobacteria bacterium AB60]
MDLRSEIRSFVVVAAVCAATAAAAQTQTPAPAPAPSPAPAAAPADAAAPTPKPWRVGPFDVTGFVDGYYSFNDNHPTGAANGESNDLYNFNFNANQPSLSAVKLTLNHDPAPVGAHFDFIYGDTNKLINAKNQLEWVEQAYVSVKPPKAKGFELDAGKFVTAAGAETIEAKDNWNYSRSILFAWAIPYWHMGLRSSMPVTKTETVGVQLVNGWNNIIHDTGGVTVGFTSALVEPKVTWNLNVYTGPSNTPGQNAYRNLFDNTLLFTPNSKFNWYVNFDFGANRDSTSNGQGDSNKSYWTGLAAAAHEQVTPKMALSGRLEFFDDQQGYATGTVQTVKEATATYEYHWKVGLLSRAEFRHDWSDQQFFHRGATGMTDGQTTLTIGLIAVISPSR